MSGPSFDDLLPKASAPVALDNPFEDPFSGFGTRGRSSPDPWSRPPAPEPEPGWSQPEQWSNPNGAEDEWSKPQIAHTLPVSSPSLLPVVSKAESLHISTNNPNPLPSDLPIASTIQIREDPLDAASSVAPSSPLIQHQQSIVGAANEPVKEESPRLTSGSFSPPIIQPHPDIHHPIVTTSLSPTPDSFPSEPPSRSSAFSEPVSSFSRAASEAPSKYERIVSPLETPPAGPTVLDRSFSHLALGGEVSGWSQGPAEWSTSQDPVQQASPWPSTSQRQTGWTDDSSSSFANGSQQVPPDTSASTLHEPQSPVLAQVDSPGHPRPLFVINVGDPQKVGDPISAHILYTVQTRTSSPLFHKPEFSVLRRYSDFLWLFDTLCANNPGVVVPPVPEKHSFGRFQDAFVEARCLALNKCIQKIANHPMLCNDPDLKLFLESDSFALDIKHRKAESNDGGGGLIAALSSTIAGPRFFETDEWFDRKKAYLDSLESQLKGLVKAIEFVSKQRIELILATAEFADAIAALSGSDLSRPLSHSLGILADVERKSKDLQEVQSREEVVTIMGTVEEYTRLINSVRLAFASRVKSHMSWQTADSDLRRIKSNHDRNRKQGRIPNERMSYALSEIAEAEKRAHEARHDYDSVSKMLKNEMNRFEMERVDDFKASLEAFLDGMIARQKEIIRSWESYQESLLRRTGSNPKTLPEATLLSPTPS